MSQPIVGLQRRMMELGRIRLGGEKGERQPGKKLKEFRLTSASRSLLEAAAVEYGGTVTDWQGAPDEGYFQLYTKTDTLDIILPPVFSDRDGSPTLPYSQAYELFKGPERVRCCDGVTETISAKPCLCNPDDRECQIMTRLNVMLPKIPGLGVWLLQSHGWNAASVLPGTLEVLQMAAADRTFIPAVLRLEARTSKKDGTTRKFVVPVIDLPDLRIGELMGSSGGRALNGPSVAPARPALPPAVDPPSATRDSEPEFPAPPPLSTLDATVANLQSNGGLAEPGVSTSGSASSLDDLIGTYGIAECIKAARDVFPGRPVRELSPDEVRVLSDRLTGATVEA